MKRIIVLTISVIILFGSCEEQEAEMICDAVLDTPESMIPKFMKWKLPSFFRGFNIGYYCSNTDCYKNQDDFLDMKTAGANLAQINVYGEGFREFSSPYETNEIGKQHIRCMATWAHNAGLYYTIAVREGPGRHDVAKDRSSPVWTDLEMQEYYGIMLKEIASEFVNDSLFVGLILTVEPDPLSSDWDRLEDARDAIESNGIDLYSIFKSWIDEIRLVSTDLPIMVQSAESSNPEFWGDEVFLKKQTDQYIVYEVHSYEPFTYTHARRVENESYPYIGWNITTNNNEQIWDRAFYETTIFKHVLEFQAKYDVPIYLGEFGMYYPQLNGVTYLKDIHSIAIKNGWSFSLWSWRADKSDKHIYFNYENFDSYSSEGGYWEAITQMMNN